MLVLWAIAIIVWIGLPAMWLWAEFKWSRPARLFAGILMLVSIAVFSIVFYQTARKGIEEYLASDYASTLFNIAEAIRADRGGEVINLIDAFDVENFDAWDYGKVHRLVDDLGRLAPSEPK